MFTPAAVGFLLTVLGSEIPDALLWGLVMTVLGIGATFTGWLVLSIQRFESATRELALLVSEMRDDSKDHENRLRRLEQGKESRYA